VVTGIYAGERSVVRIPTKTWKSIERRFARLFGARRLSLSGSDGKISQSDTMHERLFIEVKHRSRSEIVSLYRKIMPLARKEGKIPVIGLHGFGTDLYLVVVDVRYLRAVAREYVGPDSPVG